MGFDCSAITVIGLRLLKKDLQITTSYLACQHQENQNHYHYCPICGIQNNTSTTTFIKEFLPKNNDYLYGTIKGYPVYQFDLEKWLYVCLNYGERQGPRSYDPKDTVLCPYSLENLVIMKDKMKADLSPLGLWNDEKFGIYTLIQYSY